MLKPQWDLPSISSSPGWTGQVTLATPPKYSPTDPSPSSWPSIKLSNSLMSFSYIIAPKTAPSTQLWDSPLPCPAGNAVPSAPQGISRPPGCQGTADSYSPCHPPGPSHPFLKCFSPASHSPACLLPHLSCRICHLTLLNFICLVIAQPSNLPRYLQGLPAFKGVNSSSQFSVILGVPWSLASMSLMKMLKRTGLSLMSPHFL